jgi:hypothetical protein
LCFLPSPPIKGKKSRGQLEQTREAKERKKGSRKKEKREKKKETQPSSQSILAICQAGLGKLILLYL